MAETGAEIVTNNGQKLTSKLAMSDGDVGINSRERTAIECLSPLVTEMPESRLDRLIQEITKLLQDKKIEDAQVCHMSREKIDELNKEVKQDLSTKLTRGITGYMVETEVALSRSDRSNLLGHKILTFEKGENRAATIAEFERTICTTPIEKLSSRGLANYLLYLTEYRWDGLQKEYLEQTIGKEKLLRLAILWGHDVTQESKGTTLAQKYLAENKNHGLVARTRTDHVLRGVYAEQRALVEQAKKVGTFERTEVALRELFPSGNTAEIGKHLDEASDLADIFERLSRRGLSVSSESQVDKILRAIRDDSESRVQVATLANSLSPIDPESRVDRIMRGLAKPVEKMPDHTKKLTDLTIEEVSVLLDALGEDAKPDRETQEIRIFLQNEKDRKIALWKRGQSVAVRESPRAKKAVLSHASGKSDSSELRSSTSGAVKIREEHESLRTELMSNDSAISSMLKGMGYTTEELLQNAERRKVYLDALRNKGTFTPEELRLKIILEKIQRHEQRRDVFESKGSRALDRYDRAIADGKSPSQARKEATDKTNDRTWEAVQSNDPRSSENEHQQTTRRGIPFDRIDVGMPHTAPLDRRNPLSEPVTISNVGAYTYRVELYGSNMDLTREQVRPYLGSLRFMEKAGLGYFTRELWQQSLHNLLSSFSSAGETLQIDNKNGLKPQEKIRILQRFAHLLDIPGDIRTVEDGTVLLKKHFFTGESIQTTLRSKGIIRNEHLDETMLRIALTGKET